MILTVYFSLFPLSFILFFFLFSHALLVLCRCNVFGSGFRLTLCMSLVFENAMMRRVFELILEECVRRACGV